MTVEELVYSLVSAAIAALVAVCTWLAWEINNSDDTDTGEEEPDE